MRGDASKVRRIAAGLQRQEVVCDNWYMLCCTRITETRYPSEASIMLNVQRLYSEPIVEPTPRTPSDEDIGKADAIREALRRQLLGRAEPQIIPCWIVGAD